MKVYVNSAKENWIVDRYRKEWIKYNKDSFSFAPNRGIIWLMSPWTWKKIPKRFLSREKVLCTIHHIDENKFYGGEEKNFYERDRYVDHYHVISDKTYEQVDKLTNKPITKIPFWINQNLWFEISKKDQLRKKYKLNKDHFIVGSFQRDTEGADLISPKLSKGPDRLVEIFLHLRSLNKNFVVILTGKRRQYIINKCIENKLKYLYFENCNFKTMNELYNLLNLYVVASRFEGGPAAIMESAIIKTPIISTDVGIASEILHPQSIFNMENFESAKPQIDYAHKKIQNFIIPKHFENYKRLLNEIYEN